MDRSARDFYDHPVFQHDRLHLETPAIQGLRDELHRWLWTGATGGLILGAARVGKTTAVRTLASQLRARDNTPIPVYYVSMPLRDQHTVMTVFRQLCWSVGLRSANHDRADHLADRFLHYIADRAVESDSRYAVLIVDEMQRLTPLQFGPFAELHDRLRLLDMALTHFFVGNDQESSELLEACEQPRYAHIHGRFFAQRTTFPGLTSREQVHFCLSQYDRLRYPADGPTYTGYFLPEAEQQGWRLASLAGDLWRVFREYQTAYAIDSWGMQYFVATVNTLLTDFLADLGVEAFDDEMVHECVRISGLVPALVRPA
ncbi:ATP-binding protein [Halofilum ochraceum]|uniref:ATP-binding protein n=1 Tax=Halofilum ochraceum TaxID=1611323 RepID=UPI0008DA24AE|nr:ATP-binding protein [Halofilum ochraceum]